jgi:3-hydroxyisobutyrate dehydrogenase
MMTRALVHGRRRAEEVREVARTVEDAGLEPMQSLATAQRQDWAADQGGALPPALLRGDSLDALLDALLALRPPR